MRRKKEAVLSFESSDEGLPKVVRDYRARYRAISQVLDDNRKILSAVHKDLLKLSEGDCRGTGGRLHVGEHLRALIVQHLEGLPFREAVIRIGSDPFLQDFLRMRKRAVMDYSFLDKCFLVIRPQTWQRVNELLGRIWSCGRNGQHQRHPHRHDRGGIQHPLSHRCVAAVGHLAGGIAAVDAGPGDRSRKAARTASTTGRSSGCTCTSRATCPASRNLASGR